MNSHRPSRTPSWVPPTGTGTDRFDQLVRDVEQLKAQVQALTELAADLYMKVTVLEENNVHPE